MFDRRLITNFDWVLLLLTLVLASFGVLTIFSATQGGKGWNLNSLYFKQIVWIGIGLGAMAAVILVDYRTIGRHVYILYALMILSLVGVEVAGRTISGSQRWLSLGPFSFQPSELAKLTVILTLARYFHESKQESLYRLRDLWLPGLLVLIPMGLIIKQPDLGTALIILLISLTMVLVVGMQPRSLAILIILGLVALPVGWVSLKDYQRQRLVTLFSPETDVLGSGYHSLQSKIAIGSGGLWGKGLFAGTQNRLNFLPEKHTDFIFAVFAEEMGFVRTIILFFLYWALLFRSCSLARKAQDKMATLIAIGVVSMLTSYIVLNIGMTIGLAPVVGIPFPLMSYGGSAMLTTMVGIGLLLNFRMRRFMY